MEEVDDDEERELWKRWMERGRWVHGNEKIGKNESGGREGLEIQS
jgi:hypothetical protein